MIIGIVIGVMCDITALSLIAGMLLGAAVSKLKI